MELKSFTDITKVLEPAIQDLTDALDPVAYQAELEAALAPYAGPDEDPARVAAIRHHATRRIEDARAGKAGEAAYTLQEVTKIVGAATQALVAREEAAPSPEQAWLQRTKEPGLSTGTDLQLTILHELRLGRYDREYGHAGPAQIDAVYEAALRDPFDQAKASLIAWVEAHHGAGWAGRAVSQEEALRGDSSRLLQRIRATAEARRSEDARAALALIAKADKCAQEAAGQRVGAQKVTKRVTSAWRQLVTA
jgi:hypothetical protein